jgi:hypothetical protein
MRTTRWCIPLFTLALGALSARASAEDAPAAPAPDAPAAPAAPAAAKSSRGAFVAGAKFGGIIPFDGLGANVVGSLEVGYILPFAKGSFGLLVDVGYAVPKTSGSVANDMRVDGGKYDWHLTQKELTISPTVTYRLTMLGRVVPYVGVGPRIYLLQSVVRGAVGAQTILETTEQSTKVGLSAPLGVDFRLGPGALLGEFLFEWGPLNHIATGDGTNTMGGTLQIGYRFMI